jgi:cell division transport system permease protein
MNKQAAQKEKSRWSLKTYFSHHLHALNHGIQQLTKTPLTTLLTIAILSITLVLPTCLLMILSNIDTATQHWDKGSTISVYTNSNLTTQQVGQIRQSLSGINNIETIQYISPQQGLTDFSQQSGLNDIIQSIGHNPLPGVFKVTPQQQTTLALDTLQSQIQKIANVSAVKFDLQWIKRFNAIINLLKQFTYALAFILAMAVLLIIANIIRMTLQRYHQEIEVMKLVGASHGFIRRPFLYSGALYGLCSGVFTAIVLDSFLLWLQPALNQLTDLYNTQFTLQGLDLEQTGLLILISVSLGFIASWAVVNKRLKTVKMD